MTPGMPVGRLWVAEADDDGSEKLKLVGSMTIDEGIKSSVLVRVAVGRKLVMGFWLELEVTGGGRVDVSMVVGGKGTEVNVGITVVGTSLGVVGTSLGVDGGSLGVGRTSELVELMDSVGDGVTIGVGGTSVDGIDVGGRLVVSMEDVELLSVGGSELEVSEGMGVALPVSDPGMDVVGSDVTDTVAEPLLVGGGSEDVTLMTLESDEIGRAVEDSETGGIDVTLLVSDGVGSDTVTDSLGAPVVDSTGTDSLALELELGIGSRVWLGTISVELISVTLAGVDTGISLELEVEDSGMGRGSRLLRMLEMSGMMPPLEVTGISEDGSALVMGSEELMELTGG
jgi:hypothetical protein